MWFYLGGMHGLIRGGMHGFIPGGHAWFYLGGCAWFYSGGMRGFIQGGGGHAWFFQFFLIQSDTVNERAVRILLECILVMTLFGFICDFFLVLWGTLFICLCNLVSDTRDK